MNPLLRTSRPFRKPKRRRALWSPTGGGDVADNPIRLDVWSIVARSRRDTRPTRQHALPPERRGLDDLSPATRSYLARMNAVVGGGRKYYG